MFVHFNGRIHNADNITDIDYSRLVSHGVINVCFSRRRNEEVFGPEAVTLVMTLCPDALEGQQAKYMRHAWAIHNLIGHPLMQLFSWLHLSSLGIKIHDLTVPNPIESE